MGNAGPDFEPLRCGLSGGKEKVLDGLERLVGVAAEAETDEEVAGKQPEESL